MVNKVDFSIILLSYNSANTIENSLLSILNQKEDNIEIILLDGGSSDETMLILEKYRHSIDCIISESDGGPVKAINKGCRLAKGNYIIILCSDDELQDGYFKALNTHINTDPDVISTSLRIVKNDLISRIYKNQDLAFKYQDILKAPLSNSRIIKNSIYYHLGGYDERYKFCSDLDFLLRVSKIKNLKCIEVNESIYCFKVHDGSRTSGIHNLYEIYLEELSVYCNQIIRFGISINIFYCILRSLRNIIKFHLKSIKL